MHTYIPTYLHTFITTYLHTYIPSYIPTDRRTYIHAYYIHTLYIIRNTHYQIHVHTFTNRITIIIKSTIHKHERNHTNRRAHRQATTCHSINRSISWSINQSISKQINQSIKNILVVTRQRVSHTEVVAVLCIQCGVAQTISSEVSARILFHPDLTHYVSIRWPYVRKAHLKPELG